MPNLAVVDMEGKNVGTIELAESVFGIEPNAAVMQQNYLKKQAIRSFTLTQNILSGPEPAVLPLIFYPSI